MNKKYIIVENDSIYHNCKKLYRIKSLVDIPHIVKKGDLGGYVEGEHNLSHEGNCWVGSESIVCDKALVTDDALVTGCSFVEDYALVGDGATIIDSFINGFSDIDSAAHLESGVRVGEHSVINGNVYISGNFSIKGYAHIVSQGDFITFCYNYQNVIFFVDTVYDIAMTIDGELFKTEDFIDTQKLPYQKERAKEIVNFAKKAIRDPYKFHTNSFD